MPAPKTPDRLKNGGRLRKLTCFGGGHQVAPIVYASRGAIATHGVPLCACGSPFMFASVEDCAAITPDDLPYHPLAGDERAREYRAALDDELEQRETCAGCDARAPLGALNDWYCASCGSLNSTYIDGSRCVEKATGAGELEKGRERADVVCSSAPRIHYPRNRTIALQAAPAAGTREKVRDAIPF